MALIKKADEIYKISVYRSNHYEGSVVVTTFNNKERSMSGTHVMSADLVALETVCRAAATFFGLQANAITVGELVQRRLDELIAEEQREHQPGGDEING